MKKLNAIKQRLERYKSEHTNTDEKLEEGSIAEWVTHSDGDMSWLVERVDDLLEALEYALRQTGCDGDLCTEDWHEEARRAIVKADA